MRPNNTINGIIRFLYSLIDTNEKPNLSWIIQKVKSLQLFFFFLTQPHLSFKRINIILWNSNRRNSLLKNNKRPFQAPICLTLLLFQLEIMGFFFAFTGSGKSVAFAQIWPLFRNATTSKWETAKPHDRAAQEFIHANETYPCSLARLRTKPPFRKVFCLFSIWMCHILQ